MRWRFFCRWKATSPFGINHREDPETEHPDGMNVHLDGGTEDLATHEGDWDDKCAKRVEEEDVVLSYSGGSVKEAGTFGSGGWHVKGGTLMYSHKEFPGRLALSSGRVELVYTLRCLVATRLEDWTGLTHHHLDNQGVVKMKTHEIRFTRGDSSRRGPVGRYAAVVQGVWPQNQDHMGERGRRKRRKANEPS